MNSSQAIFSYQPISSYPFVLPLNQDDSCTESDASTDKGTEYFEERFSSLNRNSLFKPRGQIESQKSLQLGRRLTNRKNNRDLNFWPMDKDLVDLSKEGYKYINANHYNKAIVAQGPLETTVDAFLTMALKKKFKHIICLTEAGENNKTCFPYWEQFKNKVSEVTWKDGPVEIDSDNDEKIIKRVLRIVVNGQKKHVLHWHYIGWRDKEACSPHLLARLIILIDNEPHIVHGSKGVGRSGVFTVTNSFIHCILEKGNQISDQQIYIFISQLRERRPGSVQSPAQLRLIFDTLDAYMEERIKQSANIPKPTQSQTQNTTQTQPGVQNHVEVRKGLNLPSVQNNSNFQFDSKPFRIENETLMPQNLREGFTIYPPAFHPTVYHFSPSQQDVSQSITAPTHAYSQQMSSPPVNYYLQQQIITPSQVSQLSSDLRSQQTSFYSNPPPVTYYPQQQNVTPIHISQLFSDSEKNKVTKS